MGRAIKRCGELAAYGARHGGHRKMGAPTHFSTWAAKGAGLSKEQRCKPCVSRSTILPRPPALGTRAEPRKNDSRPAAVPAVVSGWRGARWTIALHGVCRAGARADRSPAVARVKPRAAAESNLPAKRSALLSRGSEGGSHAHLVIRWAQSSTTGRAPFTGDVASRDDKIAAVGRASARGTIDADGLHVTPGWSTCTRTTGRVS